jgi:hypothetical protein
MSRVLNSDIVMMRKARGVLKGRLTVDKLEAFGSEFETEIPGELAPESIPLPLELEVELPGDTLKKPVGLTTVDDNVEVPLLPILAVMEVLAREVIPDPFA